MIYTVTFIKDLPQHTRDIVTFKFSDWEMATAFVSDAIQFNADESFRVEIKADKPGAIT